MLVLQRPLVVTEVEVLELSLVAAFVLAYLICSKLLGVFWPIHYVQIGCFVLGEERFWEQGRFGVVLENVRSYACYAGHSHREQMG